VRSSCSFGQSGLVGLPKRNSVYQAAEGLSKDEAKRRAPRRLSLPFLQPALPRINSLHRLPSSATDGALHSLCLELGTTPHKNNGGAGFQTVSVLVLGDVRLLQPRLVLQVGR
jgi:hypothetical protein